jgi:Tat protein translocase TatB subunit
MVLMLLDIGAGELVLLAVLAAILLGPERVPPLAKKAARILRFLRGVANNATSQIKSELGPEYADLSVGELHPKNLIQQVLPTAELTSDMGVNFADLGFPELAPKQLVPTSGDTHTDLHTEMDALRAELAQMKAEVDRLNHSPLPTSST